MAIRFGDVDYKQLAGMRRLLDTATQNFEKNAMLQAQLARERSETDALAHATNILARARQPRKNAQGVDVMPGAEDVNRALVEAGTYASAYAPTRGAQFAETLSRFKQTIPTPTVAKPERTFQPRRDEKGNVITKKIGAEEFIEEEEVDRERGATGLVRYTTKVTGKEPKDVDPLDEQYKKLRIDTMKKELEGKDKPEKRTITARLWDGKKPLTRQFSGTKDQLKKVLQSEISSLEKNVTAFEQAKGSGGFLGIGADKSWEEFKKDPTEANINDLHKDIKGFASSYLDLTDKLETLENEVDLTEPTETATPGRTVKTPSGRTVIIR